MAPFPLRGECGLRDVTDSGKNNSRPEGSIYERFAYTPHLGGYPNCSDMNELCAIRYTFKTWW